MMKPLFVFATLHEAKIPLEKFKAIRVSDSIYQTEIADYLFTGMGAVRSASSLSYTLAKTPYKEVYNIGFAGALKDHPYGEVFHIDSVKKHLPHAGNENFNRLFSLAFPEVNLHNRVKGSLVTTDFPIHDPILKQKLSQEYDLVDMEAWGVAWTCTQLNIPCTLIKVVSDFCSTNTSQEIKEKCLELSNILYHHVVKII